MDKRFVIPGLYRLESERSEFITASPDDFTANGSRILTVANPGPSGPGMTLAAIGSTPNANGATFASNVFNLQPANGSFGGVVTTGAQTFGGLKTFSGGISATGLISGLVAIGSVPNANGASTSGSNLSLQPADANFGGVVTTTAQGFSGAKTFFNGIYLGSELQLLSVYREGSMFLALTNAGTTPAEVFIGENPVPFDQIPVSFVQIGKIVTIYLPPMYWDIIDTPINQFNLNTTDQEFPIIDQTYDNPIQTIFTIDDSGAPRLAYVVLNNNIRFLYLGSDINTIKAGIFMPQLITYKAL
jgi:hypothetical protein